MNPLDLLDPLDLSDTLDLLDPLDLSDPMIYQSPWINWIWNPWLSWIPWIFQTPLDDLYYLNLKGLLDSMDSGEVFQKSSRCHLKINMMFLVGYLETLTATLEKSHIFF